MDRLPVGLHDQIIRHIVQDTDASHLQNIFQGYMTVPTSLLTLYNFSLTNGFYNTLIAPTLATLLEQTFLDPIFSAACKIWSQNPFHGITDSHKQFSLLRIYLSGIVRHKRAISKWIASKIIPKLPYRFIWLDGGRFQLPAKQAAIVYDAHRQIGGDASKS
ncbi:uncharacterized protein KY384_000744 [Bacidia gigantensis]|uniref:uncharacterized protein n=1 Tax=Bacidia gigantensis TaxID=2732470 RepID=UPI001D0366F8|nr:uncharacterized protein KY384_000744 [Bacidia gigantensis]KAG8525982.1 hypothetical protein KY384_000744 [Bacidia gigantensis]